uniref:Uncharacterized protein n=1 Tax=Arundo donax TaxID=35708 RepID=A0A0A9ALT7_ARUDO
MLHKASIYGLIHSVKLLFPLNISLPQVSRISAKTNLYLLSLTK